LSVRAAQIAEESGYEKVAVLEGGLGAWTREGYPVESGS
jgi:rhodanese-related sulfurtransferase